MTLTPKSLVRHPLEARGRRQKPTKQSQAAVPVRFATFSLQCPNGFICSILF